MVSWKQSVDLKIPGPDGLEVYRTVRQSGSNMPMLMLTARDAHEDGVTGPDTGAELEHGHGKLVYAFDIRNGRGTIDEVQVSAITGKIVRVEHESKKQRKSARTR